MEAEVSIRNRSQDLSDSELQTMLLLLLKYNPMPIKDLMQAIPRIFHVSFDNRVSDKFDSLRNEGYVSGIRVWKSFYCQLTPNGNEKVEALAKENPEILEKIQKVFAERLATPDELVKLRKMPVKDGRTEYDTDLPEALKEVQDFLTRVDPELLYKTELRRYLPQWKGVDIDNFFEKLRKGIKQTDRVY